MWVENDYFNAEGDYLGSDNNEDSYEVRIIDQKLWSSMDYEDQIDKDLVSKDDYSLASESGISEEASFSIVEHYNPTGLELISDDLSAYNGLMAFGELNRTPTLKVDMKVMIENKYINNHQDIESTYVHENKHYSDYKEMGRVEYARVFRPRIEMRAIETQEAHPTYDNISPSKKRSIASNRRKMMNAIRENPFKLYE